MTHINQKSNTMSVIKTVFVFIFFGFIQLNNAQQTAIYSDPLEDYTKALRLYKNKQYKAAQVLFFEVKNESSTTPIIEADCAYYIANSAIRLEQQNAETLIENFVEDYPTSNKRNSAFLNVADYYFSKAKYAYAQKWFDKVDEASLTVSEQERYNFNYGYTLYIGKDKKAAQKYLNRVTNSETYGAQAKYYIGYMAYEGDDYDKANSYFEQVSDDNAYKEKLSYYQADLNFKLGKFDKAISLAKEQLPKSTDEEVSELSKIIGESYFNLKQYKEAIPFLKDYQGKKGKWNNTDYYQLGYAYYKQNQYDLAISEFNKIIDGKNFVAQNAYYHLGKSYINLNKKQEALNAFKNASEMPFDEKIKEDASFNYAKISYEIGNPYLSVPQVLNNFLESYPKSEYKDEIEPLLIDSYITSKNYKEALTLLKGKSSDTYKTAYQKVAFYRGVELFNANQINEAKSLFEAAIKTPKDETFVMKAKYWKAETDYNLSNFNDALKGFNEVKTIQNQINSTFENIDYNIGYCHFKLKNYIEANTFFKNYLAKNNDDDLRKNDTYLRMADGYFVSTDYQNAIRNYDNAIKIGKIETDYASFQKAMSQGYIGNTDLKIKGLNDFIKNHPSSALNDDAFYALGNTYVKQNDNQKAIKTYDLLLKNHPESIFKSKTLLRQGLIFYNDGENEAALKKYKSIASDFPNSEEANQAIASAKLVYIDIGKVDEYAAWVKTLDYADITDIELDNATYTAAEKQYLDGKTKRAIKLFNDYLNQYPKGIHNIQSHFYLAELYYKEEQFNDALPHYKAIIVEPKGEFTEQSLLHINEIYLKTKDWDNAIVYLERLEVEAENPQNKLYAQSNLMNAFYQTETYDKASSYAEVVLSDSNLDEQIKSDAQIIIARSAFKLEDFEKAKSAYAKLETFATGKLAAESLYYNSYFKNKDGLYEKSNEVVQELARDYSSYKYFSAKGLVIMAKNFNALDDDFQATYILESVIENFTDFEDVISEAESLLNKIKEEAAKTNASVETDN